VVFGLSICDTVFAIFESYLGIHLFEVVGYFPHFGAVICKCGPLRVVYVFLPV
jgi:hypothetical protein